MERNGSDYGIYLARVFADDPQFMAAVDTWVVEEVQHGMALGRWARLADPAWDFDAAFERFRELVEGYAFPQVGRVTVSIGFTEVQLQDTPNAAFSRADQSVYLAKHQGRNRVVLSDIDRGKGSPRMRASTDRPSSITASA